MTATEFVQPAYGSRSLADVLPAVGKALGVPVGDTTLELPAAPAYVVLLVDGLGARLVERYAAAAPYLAELLGRSQPGTAGVPSTTATSLSSFGTGLAPGAHGLVGFTARVPSSGLLLNHLFWDQDVDPHTWQPHPTVFSRLAARGVDVTTVNKRAFEGSGLTVASSRGATYVGADTVDERLAAARSASTAHPSLTYLYESDLDSTGHRWGVASSQWLHQLALVDAQVQQLRESLPPQCRLVVVADHGMVDSPEGSRIDVDDHAELTDGVALLGGEARFRHLYCRDGAVDDVVAAWSAVLGERAEVLTRSEATGRGWFGPVDAPVLPRLGDVVVACRGDLGIFSTERFAYEATLVGLHGSLTPDEMLIPILLD